MPENPKSYPPYERHLFVCTNERPPDNKRGCCKSKGAEQVLQRFKDLVEQKNLKPQIRAQKSGCLDTCEFGVSVVVYPEAVWYARVTPADVDEIVESHLVRGVVVQRLVMHKALPKDSGKIQPVGGA